MVRKMLLLGCLCAVACSLYGCGGKEDVKLGTQGGTVTSPVGVTASPPPSPQRVVVNQVFVPSYSLTQPRECPYSPTGFHAAGKVDANGRLHCAYCGRFMRRAAPPSIPKPIPIYKPTVTFMKVWSTR